MAPIRLRFPRARRAAPLPALALLLSLSASSVAAAASWQQQDGPFGGTVVAVDRIASGAVYAMRNDTVFRTTNDGATWIDVGPSAPFTFLALDVAENGAIWTGTSSRGVAWSLNGGVSWTNDQIVTNPHSGTGATIIAIGVDPQGRVLAGGYRSVNQGGSFTPMTISGLCFAFDAAGEAVAGTVDGVWRSANGGASWTPANAGMSGERITALRTDGPTGLWAGTQDGAVWRSTDGGLTWVPGTTGLSGTPVQAVEVIPGAVLAATSGGGLFRSTDGGVTWIPAAGNPGDVRDLRAAPGALWYGAAAHGVFLSTDGAATAAGVSAAAMYAPDLRDAVADPAGTLFLASGECGVFRSVDGGTSWALASGGLAGNFVRDLATIAAGEVWAAGWIGVHVTTDGGGSWSVAGFADRHAWRVVPLSASTVLAVVDGAASFPTVQRSTDGGATWTETWSSATVFQLPSSAVADDGTVLVGGSSFFGGSVLRSTDAGTTWAEESLGFQGVQTLAADASGNAWAATGDNVVHRSTDRGATWQPLGGGGWPTGTTGSLTSLAHGADGLLLVASGDVYRSTDLGDSWEVLGDGLPSVANATFVAETAGGTFAGTYSSGLYRLGGATGVPFPATSGGPAFAASPNPFRAATRFRWDLPRAGRVRVTIHDVQGRRVRELDAGVRPAGAGATSWDGTASGGRPVAPGHYFARLEADGIVAGTKLLRLR